LEAGANPIIKVDAELFAKIVVPTAALLRSLWVDNRLVEQ
jgi:hypothetical protein